MLQWYKDSQHKLDTAFRDSSS